MTDSEKPADENLQHKMLLVTMEEDIEKIEKYWSELKSNIKFEVEYSSWVVYNAAKATDKEEI